jgi:competence protein ComEC
MFVTLRLLVSTLMVGRARVAGECAALGAAWGYVALVGWEPSAVRAAVAMTVYVMSDLLGNRRSLPRSILLSLLIVTIIWPGCFFEMGVQLTFAALCGIAVSAVVFRGYSAVTQAICTPLVVTTTTMMVSLAWGYRSSLLGVALNPVVVPLVSLLGGPGAAAAVALTYTPVDPDGALLGVLADLLLYILVSIAELCDLPSEGLAMGLGTRGACGLGLCAMGALVLRRGYRRAVCVRGAM